ncbi:MAG: nicotinamide-nucleotide amidohydrolase family protein [Spirochaetaceae bacterium]|nr:MAG: nicotinamide-nucleotide amidohydrolase family protein [Spirochaetaceae bacterium]
MTIEQVLAEKLIAAGWTVAVAESCTGGGLGARITSVPGSSAYFTGGVISYSNAIKTGWLGVEASTIERDGAVSESVAGAMADGVRVRMKSDLGVGITGVAGPDGGSPLKPVGLVFIAVSIHGLIDARRCLFTGDRVAVRASAVETALQMLLAAVDSVHAKES